MNPPSDGGKTPAESSVEMTQMILPGDANPIGTAFGGRIMQWIDVAAAVAARRHAGCVAVTAAIDRLTFHKPIHVGDTVVLRSAVNRTWRSSMEVGVRVLCEKDGVAAPTHAATAYLTFVAVDRDGQPTPAPPLRPKTEYDRRRFDQADERRLARLKTRSM